MATKPVSFSTMYMFNRSYHSVQCSLAMWQYSCPSNQTVMLSLLAELSLICWLCLIYHLPQLLLAHLIKVPLSLHLFWVQISHTMKVHLVKKVIYLLVLTRSSVCGAPHTSNMGTNSLRQMLSISTKKVRNANWSSLVQHWCIIKLLFYFWPILIDPIDQILSSSHLDINHILLQLDGNLSHSYPPQSN